MNETTRAAIERVIETARRFVECADEFWPDYPYAITEYFDALIGAVDDLPETLD